MPNAGGDIERFRLPALKQEIKRYADAVDREQRLPVEAFAAIRHHGLLAPDVIDSPVEVFLICEAVAASCGVTSLLYDGQHLSAMLYLRHWPSDRTRDILSQVLRGEIILATAFAGQISTYGGVKARARGGRIYFDGTVHWLSGVGLCTHTLLAGEPEDDPESLYLAVVPMNQLQAGPKTELVVLTGSMTCPLTARELDVTEFLIAGRPQRRELVTAAATDQTPLMLSHATGLCAAMLELIEGARGVTDEMKELIVLLRQPLEDLREEVLESLAQPRASDGGVELRQRYFGRAQSLLGEMTSVMLSAGRGSSLKLGAIHNRLAREAMNHFARFPLSLQLALSLQNMLRAGQLRVDQSSD